MGKKPQTNQAKPTNPPKFETTF